MCGINVDHPKINFNISLLTNNKKIGYAEALAVEVNGAFESKNVKLVFTPSVKTYVLFEL